MRLLGALVLLGLSTASFAQHSVECKFNIESNKAKKDLKELRSSSITRKVELIAGQDHSEDIHINRLIAYPGEKKSNKYLIRVFGEDKREDDISQEKDIPIVRMNSSESINFRVRHDGKETKVTVKSNEGTSNLTFNGVGETGYKTFPAYSFFKYLKKDKERGMLSPVYVSCKLSLKEIIDGTEGKKEYSPLDEEREIHNKHKAKQQ